MIAGTGTGRYGCKASADLFGLTKEDLIDRLKDIIRVGELYDLPKPDCCWSVRQPTGTARPAEHDQVCYCG
jgi:hypothetical protein